MSGAPSSTSPPRIRVLVVDDHAVVRVGLREILDAQPDMVAVGEASDGVQAVAALREHRPDVVLMDLRMPGGDGIAAIKNSLDLAPKTAIVVLTTYDGDEDVYRAIQAGARGYLLKDTFPQALCEAIRHVHAGGRLFSPSVAPKVSAGRDAPRLTAREIAIVELVARGLTNREIQVALSMAEGTLKNHLRHIFDKLDATDRTEATLIAIQRGIIHL
jgi:two-component system, NarL family, response regulator